MNCNLNITARRVCGKTIKAIATAAQKIIAMILLFQILLSLSISKFLSLTKLFSCRGWISAPAYLYYRSCWKPSDLCFLFSCSVAFYGLSTHRIGARRSAFHLTICRDDRWSVSMSWHIKQLTHRHEPLPFERIVCPQRKAQVLGEFNHLDMIQFLFLAHSIPFLILLIPRFDRAIITLKCNTEFLSGNCSFGIPPRYFSIQEKSFLSPFQRCSFQSHLVQ